MSHCAQVQTTTHRARFALKTVPVIILMTLQDHVGHPVHLDFIKTQLLIDALLFALQIILLQQVHHLALTYVRTELSRISSRKNVLPLAQLLPHCLHIQAPMRVSSRALEIHMRILQLLRAQQVAHKVTLLITQLKNV